MHRDLRDQCVSRYFHVLNDENHRHHALYRSSPEERGLAHSVEVTIEHYRDWVEGWLQVIEAKPTGSSRCATRVFTQPRARPR